jgi:hypothetical protein
MTTTSTAKASQLKRIKAIRKGTYSYNKRVYTVIGIQRWWFKFKSGRRKSLGGFVWVSTTKQGSGAFVANTLEIGTFARHAKRIG